MSLLTLPTEIRLHIYSFLFPSPKSHIILVPYNPSNPECQFEIPLSLYGVCKTIHHELLPLREQLRSLHLVYIVHFYMNEGGERPTDAALAVQKKNMERMTRFAERIRVVGWNRAKHTSWNGSYPLIPWLNDACVVRTIEIQPLTVIAQRMWTVTNRNLHLFGSHIRDTVLDQLELKLIREGYNPKYYAERTEEENERDLDQLEKIIEKWMGMSNHGKQYWSWRPYEAYRDK